MNPEKVTYEQMVELAKSTYGRVAENLTFAVRDLGLTNWFAEKDLDTEMSLFALAYKGASDWTDRDGYSVFKFDPPWRFKGHHARLLGVGDAGTFIVVSFYPEFAEDNDILGRHVVDSFLEVGRLLVQYPQKDKELYGPLLKRSVYKDTIG